MNLITKPKCQICPEENPREALGVFRNKWICGICLLKFENKIRQQNNRALDIIEQEIKDDN